MPTKALIIGGAGFLGSHCVRECLKRNPKWEVTVLDNFSVGRRKHIPIGVQTFKGDIRDRSVLAKAMQGVDFVFNYAAEPFIPDSYDTPDPFIETNIQGNFNVLMVAKELGVKRILQISSAEVYGQGCRYNGLQDEDLPLAPVSTYAATKVAIDNLCRTLFYEQDVPVIIARQFNCIGERETHRYVVPEIIDQLTRPQLDSNRSPDGTIHLHLGNYTQRDFMYAGDAVRMAIDLIQFGLPGVAYNIGSGESHSVYELVDQLTKMLDIGEYKIHVSEEKRRNIDIQCLRANMHTTHSTISTRREVSLKSALGRTLKDYQENGWAWNSKD